MKRESFLLSGAAATLAGCAGSVVPPGSATGIGAELATERVVPNVSGSGDQLLGSIALFPYAFSPSGFLPCDGRQLPVRNHNALFSLLLTRFGGDGETTFHLPNMQGREPIKNLSYNIAMQGVFPSRSTVLRRGTTPYLGELLLVPYVQEFLPPKGWSVCDGKSLAIGGHRQLFSLLGYRFGSPSQTHFSLPELRSAAPKGLT